MEYPHKIYPKRHSSRLLIFLYLVCYTRGDCLLVYTSVGDDAVLPCEVDPNIHPTIDPDLAVHWTRQGLPPDQYVHFLRDGKDIVDLKYSSYKERTSISMDEVKKGNMSLKLSRVNSSDAGNYTCFIPDFPGEVTIQLIVVHGRDITGLSTTKAPVDWSQDGLVEEMTGHFPWWGGLIIIIIIIIISGLIYNKRQSLLDLCTQFLPNSIGGDHGPMIGVSCPMIGIVSEVKTSLKVVDETSTGCCAHSCNHSGY